MSIMEYSLAFAGLGLAIFAIFAPYMGINMPRDLAWTGGSLGLLLFLWFILLAWKTQRFSICPSLLIIICLSGIIGGAVWQIDSLRKLQLKELSSTKQPTASEIASEVVKKFP